MKRLALRRPAMILVVILAVLAPFPHRAQESSTAQTLIRQEAARQTIEDAIDDMLEGAADGEITPDIVAAADRISALGSDAVPFLVTEIEQKNRATFFLAAYTLGRIDTPQAAESLRAAVDTAEKERRSEWPRTRKAWACWGLALMGEPDGIARIDAGRHLSGNTPLHQQFAVIESIAVLSGPQSAASLHEQLQTITDERDPRMASRVKTLTAMRRLADPSSVPVLIEILEEGHPVLQGEAAYALGAIDTPAAHAALLERLAIRDPRVRLGVVSGLQLNPSAESVEPVLERLEVEENASMRRMLYDIVARAGGRDTTDELLAFWERPDAADRARLTELLPELDREKAWPVLVQAMQDPNAAVAFAAARSAGRIGDERAIQLLIDAIPSPFWLRAQAAIEQLEELGATEAGDAIAARLLEVELASSSSSGERRTRVALLIRALKSLGYDGRVEELREAIARQNDLKIVADLERLLADLELAASNGGKRKRWLASLASAEADQRRLAYDWFARRGDPASAASLVQMFGRVEPSEAIAIVRALGTIDAPESRVLIERILIDPSFDEEQLSSLRAMAAWSARRLGMRDALSSAVERRDGRDFLPLVYLTILSGGDGVEVLDRYRSLRLRYPALKRGLELERLDWMRRELAHGRSIARVDAPPSRVRI